MQIDPTLTEIVSCAAPSAQEVAKGVGSGYISWSLLASATLHGGALALAVFGYDIGHREKASMAGKQTVMQLQWVNVPASDPSEAVEFEFTPSSMLPEVAQEREPLEQKEPVKETESSDAAFDYVQSLPNCRQSVLLPSTYFRLRRSSDDRCLSSRRSHLSSINR